MDALFDTYAAALPQVRDWVDATFPRAEGEAPAARARAVNAKALDLLRGLLPAASLSHMGIYATGPGLRAAHPAPARPIRCRRRASTATRLLAAIKAVMPSFVVPRRAAGPRRRLGLLPRRAPRGGRALGRAARPRGAGPRGGPPVRHAHARRRRRGAAARGAAVRGRRRVGAAHARGASRRSTRRSAAGCWPTWSASARTAATAPAAASRRSATASRSSRTTARSAISSATGCSPCSGSRSRPTWARACRRRSTRPERATRTARRWSARPPSTTGSRARASPPPPRTRSASATGSATCSTSTRARRCT